MRKQICKYVIAMGIVLLAWSLAPCYGGQWQSSEWNQNVNIKNTAQGFVVDLPGKPGHLNIVRRSQNSIPKRGTISVTYRITGNGKAISLDPANGLQPNFRPAIFTGDWYDNNGRQWPTGANCMFIVPDGQTKTFTIKLTPKLWSNVQGKIGALDQTTKHISELWFAFGGGNSFTHGLQSKGKLRIEVLSVVIK